MIVLKDFVQLDIQEKNLVYRWRNHRSVVAYMRTQEISWEEHLKFLESLKEDLTKKYFLVFLDNQAIGVIDFVDICEESCEFGMYQSPDLKGYGKVLMQTLLEYAFKNLKVRNLYARVFNANTKAINLYLAYGFHFIREDALMSYFIKCGGGANFRGLIANVFYLKGRICA